MESTPLNVSPYVKVKEAPSALVDARIKVGATTSTTGAASISLSTLISVFMLPVILGLAAASCNAVDVSPTIRLAEAPSISIEETKLLIIAWVLAPAVVSKVETTARALP